MMCPKCHKKMRCTFSEPLSPRVRFRFHLCLTCHKALESLEKCYPPLYPPKRYSRAIWRARAKMGRFKATLQELGMEVETRCLDCRVNFTHLRAGRKFCSDRHRVAYHRRRQRASVFACCSG